MGRWGILKHFSIITYSSKGTLYLKNLIPAVNTKRGSDDMSICAGGVWEYFLLFSPNCLYLTPDSAPQNCYQGKDTKGFL